MGDIIRKDHVERHILASKALDNVLGLYLKEKESQTKELEHLSQQRDALVEQIKGTRMLYEKALEGQNSLSDRTEAILSFFRDIQPCLSQSEISMRRQLESIQESLSLYRISLRELESRKDYQDKAKRAVKQSSASTTQGPPPNEAPLQHQDQVFKKEVEDVKKALEQQ